MEKKAFTIKDAKIDDITLFNSIKADKSLTPGGVLNLLLDNLLSENSENQHELDSLRAENQRLQNNTAALEQENIEHIESNRLMTLQMDELKSQAPVEKEVPVPIALEGSQFIGEFDEDNFKMARKVRKFMVQDGKVKDPENFPNSLINLAVPYYLKHQYDHILDR